MSDFHLFSFFLIQTFSDGFLSNYELLSASEDIGRQKMMMTNKSYKENLKFIVYIEKVDRNIFETFEMLNEILMIENLITIIYLHKI